MALEVYPRDPRRLLRRAAHLNISSSRVHVPWSRPASGNPAIGLVELTLPVGRHGAGRAGYRLVGRMAVGRGQGGTFEELARAVVVEPVLAGLEARQQRVARGLVVG